MERRPKYRIESYTTSFEGESQDFISLQVRLKGKRLNIDISPSDFRNSPSTIKEFYKYLKAATSDGDAFDEYSVKDLFDWAMSPFLTLTNFQVQAAPAPAPKYISKGTVVTLQDLLYPETYDCEFGAVDDHLIAGRIQRREEIDEAYDIPSDLADDLLQMTAKFLSVHPSQVKLLLRRCRDNDKDKHREEEEEDSLLDEAGEDDAPDPQIDRVCVEVEGQRLFFKSAEWSGLEYTMREIRKFLKIADLGLGLEQQDLRVCRLYGIVQDEKNPVIGLLFCYIDEQSSLSYALGRPPPPESPDTTNTPEYEYHHLKRRWAAQITCTLTELHRAGVIWGDAKADNVLIDREDNAWIVDLEGGYTEGWVDHDKAGTMEGDLQGLAKIMDSIFNRPEEVVVVSNLYPD